VGLDSSSSSSSSSGSKIYGSERLPRVSSRGGPPSNLKDYGCYIMAADGFAEVSVVSSSSSSSSSSGGGGGEWWWW